MGKKTKSKMHNRPKPERPAMDPELNPLDEAASQVVELGNRIADADRETDLWDIADGLLAGVVHYWLHSRQPCGELQCEDCAPLSTAEDRMQELKRLVDQYAQESDYYHSPHDTNVGRA